MNNTDDRSLGQAFTSLGPSRKATRQTRQPGVLANTLGLSHVFFEQTTESLTAERGSQLR